MSKTTKTDRGAPTKERPKSDVGGTRRLTRRLTCIGNPEHSDDAVVWAAHDCLNWVAVAIFKHSACSVRMLSADHRQKQTDGEGAAGFFVCRDDLCGSDKRHRLRCASFRRRSDAQATASECVCLACGIGAATSTHLEQPQPVGLNSDRARGASAHRKSTERCPLGHYSRGVHTSIKIGTLGAAAAASSLLDFPKVRQRRRLYLRQPNQRVSNRCSHDRNGVVPLSARVTPNVMLSLNDGSGSGYYFCRSITAPKS